MQLDYLFEAFGKMEKKHERIKQISEWHYVLNFFQSVNGY